MSESNECAPILARLYVFLDGECPETEADVIRAHLDVCDHCVEDAEVALALKALVRRCCTESTPPAGLRARVVTTYRSISYTRSEGVEIQRDEWTTDPESRPD